MEKAIVEGIIYTRRGSKGRMYKLGIGWFREVIAKGAIERAIARPRRRFLTIHHKRMIACDDELEIWEAPEGLAFKAFIREPEIVAFIINMRLNECSFTFVAIDESIKKKRDEGIIPIDGHGIRIVKELELNEVALTVGPSAYPSEFKITYIPEEMTMKVYEHRLKLLGAE